MNIRLKVKPREVKPGSGEYEKNGNYHLHEIRDFSGSPLLLFIYDF